MEELGGTCAVIYGIIRETYQFWQSKGELVDGYCYLTIPTVEKRTKYGKKLQKKAIESLIEHGLIERVVRGMPKRQWFKLVDMPHSAPKSLSLSSKEPIIELQRTQQSAQKNLLLSSEVSLSKTRDKTREVILDDKTREERGEFYRYLQNYGMLSAWDIEKLNDSINRYGIEWCKEAFEVAKLRGHTKWSYADGIVNKWGFKYGKADKPWELERNERAHNYNRQSTKARSDVDWSKETDAIF